MEGAGALGSCSAASWLPLALVLLDRSRRRRVQAMRGDDARHESAALTSDVVSLLSLQIHDRRSPSTDSCGRECGGSWTEGCARVT